MNLFVAVCMLVCLEHNIGKIVSHLQKEGEGGSLFFFVCNKIEIKNPSIEKLNTKKAFAKL